VIERAITYLEHERRGERGEHEIAYKDERAVLGPTRIEVAGGLRTIWREAYVTCRDQGIYESCDDGFGTFQALQKGRVAININFGRHGNTEEDSYPGEETSSSASNPRWNAFWNPNENMTSLA
jgi:hypothetical protein